MASSKFWKSKRVLVTGGASFISSHIIDQLVGHASHIRVVDDLTSGKKKNIDSYVKSKQIEFIKGDLRDSLVAKRAVNKIDVVFHLAADHGGRGYVDLHQAGPASNLLLDGNVFFRSEKAGVEKIVFASSGCVYPTFLQNNTRKKIYLTEDLVKAPYEADNMYGWAKLMGELTLKAYHKEFGIKTASCRYFTVYGPRGVENHAVMAMIARAFLKQKPFQVWGDGTQIRNWTYVEDIARGTILAAEKIHDGTAVNLGTMERIRVIDAVNEIMQYTGHKSKIQFLPNMPVGPLNRVADNALAKKLLGWEPETQFVDGLHKTIDWYFKMNRREEVGKNFKSLLTGR